MLITFHCSHCNAKLRIDADAMGSQLNCPECETHITVPHQEFGPGFVVGGFAIKRKIGEGGMGQVYLARQLSMERDVALKILPPQYTRQGNFVVRFLKEVHYQAKLDHPNIVTAFEAGEDNGVYFMAMAYVEGKTL
jgi:serine/threonine protein kinase